MSRNKRKRLLAQGSEVKGVQEYLIGSHTCEMKAPLTEELEISAAVQEQAKELPGLPLLKALQESTFLYRAGRRYTATSMLVTDGVRFWTSDLNLNGIYTEELSSPLLQDQPIWRPIVGSESGWRLA